MNHHVSGKGKGKSMFWGVFLTIIGVSIIIETVFQIDIPIFRMFFAGFVIYIGVKMLVGSSRLGFTAENEKEGVTVFAESVQSYRDTHEPTQQSYEHSRSKEYSTVFGKTRIDFQGLNLESGSKEVLINTVFGETTVELPQDIPYKVESNTVFGEVRMPGGNASFMGKLVFESNNVKPGAPSLLIRVNTVFGMTKIVTK